MEADTGAQGPAALRPGRVGPYRGRGQPARRAANINIGPTTRPRRRSRSSLLARPSIRAAGGPTGSQWLKGLGAKTVKAGGARVPGEGQAQADRGCARPLRADALKTSAILIFPVPPLALGEPFDGGRDALGAGGVLLGLGDPFEIVALWPRAGSRRASPLPWGSLSSAAANSGMELGRRLGFMLELAGRRGGRAPAGPLRGSARPIASSGGRSSTEVSLPNWPIASGLASLPRISWPAPEIQRRMSFERRHDQQDFAVEREAWRAPLERFLDLAERPREPALRTCSRIGRAKGAAFAI